MKAEIRADGLHISGYVNVPGRESRPVITAHGRVNEVIEQRAFQRAIDKAGNVDLKLDHERTVASTREGTLTVYEDAVGLRAEALVTDDEVVAGARAGKLRGWSFDMRNVVDSVEERAGKLPLRVIKNFIMTEVTLAMRRNPLYASTSIELRAGEEGDETVEQRGSEDAISVTDDAKGPDVDYTGYESKIQKIKERVDGK